MDRDGLDPPQHIFWNAKVIPEVEGFVPLNKSTYNNPSVLYHTCPILLVSDLFLLIYIRSLIAFMTSMVSWLTCHISTTFIERGALVLPNVGMDPKLQFQVFASAIYGLLL